MCVESLACPTCIVWIIIWVHEGGGCPATLQHIVSAIPGRLSVSSATCHTVQSGHCRKTTATNVCRHADLRRLAAANVEGEGVACNCTGRVYREARRGTVRLAREFSNNRATGVHSLYNSRKGPGKPEPQGNILASVCATPRLSLYSNGCSLR